MTANLTGQQLREKGQRLVVDNSPEDYKNAVREAIAELIASGRPFTADDVHRMIPRELQPHHPNVLGAMLGGAASAGRIAAVSHRKSGRKSRHASHNKLWRAA